MRLKFDLPFQLLFCLLNFTSSIHLLQKETPFVFYLPTFYLL